MMACTKAAQISRAGKFCLQSTDDPHKSVGPRLLLIINDLNHPYWARYRWTLEANRRTIRQAGACLIAKMLRLDDGCAIA